MLVDRGDAARRAAAVMKRLATSPAADPSLSVSQENDARLQFEAGVPPTLVELYDGPQFHAEYPAWEAIRDSLQNASVRPETPDPSIRIVIADLLNPPSEIDLDPIVARLAEEVERAVRSEGLVP